MASLTMVPSTADSTRRRWISGVMIWQVFERGRMHRKGDDNWDYKHQGAEPLHWQELRGLKAPNQFSIEDVIRTIKSGRRRPRHELTQRLRRK
jgi:hypothetical protein